MNNLQNIPNIYPRVRVTKFSRNERGLLQTLQTNTTQLCRELIDPSYIKKSFKKFTNGLLINDDETGKRLGFVIWKESLKSKMNTSGDSCEYKHMYVLLVCGIKTEIKSGTIIMYELEKYCISNNINMIELEPANDDLATYYAKFGYTITLQTMQPIRQTFMGKIVVPIAIQKSNKTRKQNRHRHLNSDV